jgi:hypothetical protein
VAGVSQERNIQERGDRAKRDRRRQLIRCPGRQKGLLSNDEIEMEIERVIEWIRSFQPTAEQITVS